MQVSATDNRPQDIDVDTVCVGVFEEEELVNDVGDGALGALIASGEAKSSFKALALTHAGTRRWLLVGLGARKDFTPEKARVAAALAYKRASELSAVNLCWELPQDLGKDFAAALVEGTLLASYRFERYKSDKSAKEDKPAAKVQSLAISSVADGEEFHTAVASAQVAAEAVNAARDLQNTPANDMTPTHLAQRAEQLAKEIDNLTVEIEGRKEIIKRKMGAFAAVAQGTHEEPALITLTYEGPNPQGPYLGLVGKAVTFDTGGISLKPGPKMSEMKFDMSGGAVVIEAMGAIARLQLPIRIVAVVGATENMPSGHAVKPGDIVTAANGLTIEVNNTDAEGRLVLADCLHRAIELGAERLVNLATLTGAIIVTLGNTHAGLMSNDDTWAATVTESATSTGELVWRLPLHPDYGDLIKGQYGDLNNAPEGGKAGSIVAAEFLKRFVGDTPWAHIDIAGTAWNRGRPYAEKGGSGFGVRLLVDLARSLSTN